MNLYLCETCNKNNINNKSAMNMETTELNDNIELNDKIELNDIIKTNNYKNFIQDASINEIIVEYIYYKKKQIAIIENLKTTIQQITKEFNENTLLHLEEYFLKKNVIPHKKYECNLCKIYHSNTKKGLAAHKRGCKKKI